MRIAIMINTSWNIFNFRLGLIKALLDDGHEVVAIAPRDNYSDKLIENGCSFFELEMQQKGSNPIKDWQLKNRMKKILKEVDPNILLLYTIKPNIYGTLAASACKIPVINNVSGLGTVFIRNGLTSKIARLLYKWSFRKSDLIFFQNKDDRHDFIRLGLTTIEKTELLPGSGVDLKKFIPSDFKRNEQFNFLMISRVIYDKGVVEFIEAIKILKSKGFDFTATLIGAIEDDNYLGIPNKQVDQWVNDGLVVYKKPELDIRLSISNADVVVLPSYREGTPKSLLEGLAMSKPILTTDVPGCRETVIDGDNGYLCKVKDPVDLADKMERFIKKPDNQLNSMGNASRKLAETKFDEKIVIEKYKIAIQRLT